MRIGEDTYADDRYRHASRKTRCRAGMAECPRASAKRQRKHYDADCDTAEQDGERQAGRRSHLADFAHCLTNVTVARHHHAEHPGTDAEQNSGGGSEKQSIIPGYQGVSADRLAVARPEGRAASVANQQKSFLNLTLCRKRETGVTFFFPTYPGPEPHSSLARVVHDQYQAMGSGMFVKDFRDGEAFRGRPRSRIIP
jgi:hypothetical protein